MKLDQTSLLPATLQDSVRTNSSRPWDFLYEALLWRGFLTARDERGGIFLLHGSHNDDLKVLVDLSTRKVKEVTEALCGHSFSASSVSRMVATLDAELTEFHTRKLTECYPYLIVDARYERVRENGVVRSRAVLVAIGINEDGRRSVLGVELANRESATSWKEFLLGLKARGLRGVEFVVSDDHAGLRQSIPEVLPRRCGSAAMFTFCAMRWITCPGRPTTTA